MHNEKASKPRGLMRGCDASEVVFCVCVCVDVAELFDCVVALACAADSAVPVAYVRTYETSK